MRLEDLLSILEGEVFADLSVELGTTGDDLDLLCESLIGRARG